VKGDEPGDLARRRKQMLRSGRALFGHYAPGHREARDSKRELTSKIRKRTEVLRMPTCWVRLAARLLSKYGTANVKKLGANSLDTAFSPSPVSARHSTPYRDRPISLVDSIRVVVFLIVPVGRKRVHH
jgi:hypothetical protein